MTVTFDDHDAFGRTLRLAPGRSSRSRRGRGLAGALPTSLWSELDVHGLHCPRDEDVENYQKRVLQ